MISPGESKSINPWTFVFAAASRAFVALMSGPFCLQVSPAEAQALADLLRIAAANVRDGRPSSALTMLSMEIWHVVATDTGSVALVRKALMVRFTDTEALATADLLDESAAEMSPPNLTEAVAHA